MIDTDDAAPGWDAIDAALEQLYPGVTPQHFANPIRWRLGGPDPLDGLSFYPRDDHWHLVTYGMSELYSKEWESPDESGWGFEFTFRVARAADETEPSMWAANFLQYLARYVFNTGNPFGPGHHLGLNGPISQSEPETAIHAITFADDPELGVIDTPHGRLRFLQVVGLTLDEYAIIERWDALRLLDSLAPRLPLLVTDLARASLTDDAAAAMIEEGIRRDGSSTGSLYVQEAGWQLGEAGSTVTTLTFGANAATRISRVLATRLPFGRGLIVETPQSAIAFHPGDLLAVQDLGDGLAEITVPPAVLAELTATLRPVAGTYRLSSADLVVQIVKSQIRDQNGAVVAEIG